MAIGLTTLQQTQKQGKTKITIFAGIIKNPCLYISPDTCHFLQQYFDKVLVVSVPRFTHRHSRVEQHLIGLAFEYFWGTDKLQLNENEIRTGSIYHEAGARKMQRQGKALNMGEIACALSHRELYVKMIAEGWEKILILEDDVLPAYTNLDILPKVMRELPPDWELVYLGYLKHELLTTRLKIKQTFYRALSGLGLMKWDYKMILNDLLIK